MISCSHVMTSDKHEIELAWLSPAKIDCVVILCHGLGGTRDEGRGLYVEFSEMLLHRNIASVRFDFRGHGSSSVPSKELMLSGEVEDLTAVLNAVKQNYPNTPIMLVGTSFGAGPAISVARANEETIKGIALWNPVIDYNLTFVAPSTDWGKSLLLTDPQKDEGIAGKLPGKDFQLSSALYDEMAVDTTKETFRLLEMPVLLIHGKSDSKVPFRLSEAASRDRESLGLPLTTVFLDDEDHGFPNSRALVMERTCHWLVDRIDQ